MFKTISSVSVSAFLDTFFFTETSAFAAVQPRGWSVRPLDPALTDDRFLVFFNFFFKSERERRAPEGFLSRMAGWPLPFLSYLINRRPFRTLNGFRELVHSIAHSQSVATVSYRKVIICLQRFVGLSFESPTTYQILISIF